MKHVARVTGLEMVATNMLSLSWSHPIPRHGSLLHTPGFLNKHSSECSEIVSFPSCSHGHPGITCPKPQSPAWNRVHGRCFVRVC